jgi:copper chaperone CopZ
MVLVGLVFGHVAFNLNAPFREQTDACCCAHETPTLSISGASHLPLALTTNVARCPVHLSNALPALGGMEDGHDAKALTGAPDALQADQFSVRTAVFRVDGMTCVKCVRRVEAAAMRVEGSVSASADLTARTARVIGSMCTNEVANAIVAAGYQATLLNADTAAEC